MADDKLPRFLLCRNRSMAPGEAYVLHTQAPRLLARVQGADINVVEWLDGPPPAADALALAGLMRQLGNWYLTELKLEKGRK
jgi:hypothetical protein